MARPNPYEPQLLALLRSGQVRFDFAAGVVMVGDKVRRGWSDRNGYQFVKLTIEPGVRRTFSVSRIAWMQVTRSVLPPRFEVHHRDRDPSHNAWNNLFATHKLDHPKWHDCDENGKPYPDDVPF